MNEFFSSQQQIYWIYFAQWNAVAKCRLHHFLLLNMMKKKIATNIAGEKSKNVNMTIANDNTILYVKYKNKSIQIAKILFLIVPNSQNAWHFIRLTFLFTYKPFYSFAFSAFWYRLYIKLSTPKQSKAKKKKQQQKSTRLIRWFVWCFLVSQLLSIPWTLLSCLVVFVCVCVFVSWLTLNWKYIKNICEQKIELVLFLLRNLLFFRSYKWQLVSGIKPIVSLKNCFQIFLYFIEYHFRFFCETDYYQYLFLSQQQFCFFRWKNECHLFRINFVGFARKK